MNWRDLVSNDDRIERYADAEDAVSRALAAGAQSPLRYFGTGMTAHVFCDTTGAAFKVGRRDPATGNVSPTVRNLLREEGEWLKTAGRMRAVRDMVPRFHRYDAANAVLVRECVKGVEAYGRHPRSGRYMDELARKRFDVLEAAMLPRGWTVPEQKTESWAFDPEDDSKARIFDAGMAAKVGKRLVAQALRQVREGASPSDLNMTMIQVRNEALHWKSPTISIPVARKVLDALARAGGDPMLARELPERRGNPGDEELRALARAARAGVPGAKARLARESRRRGMSLHRGAVRLARRARKVAPFKHPWFGKLVEGTDIYGRPVRGIVFADHAVEPYLVAVAEGRDEQGRWMGQHWAHVHMLRAEEDEAAGVYDWRRQKRATNPPTTTSTTPDAFLREFDALWRRSPLGGLPYSVEFTERLRRIHDRNPRRYAECEPANRRFFFAPQTLDLPRRHRLGLVAHEIGHAMHGGTPHSEDEADEAALAGTGVRIGYDRRFPGKGLQVKVNPREESFRPVRCAACASDPDITPARWRQDHVKASAARPCWACGDRRYKPKGRAKNPLSGVEANSLLLHGQANLREARRTSSPTHAAYEAGKARARGAAVASFGPVVMQPSGRKLSDEGKDVAKLARRVRGENPSENPPFKLHRFLTLRQVESAVPLMEARHVSEVARSPRGFLAAYRRAGGDWRRLPIDWLQKREAFIARHHAQLRKHGEPLRERDGTPTRRHLALIAWAWSPDIG